MKKEINKKVKLFFTGSLLAVSLNLHPLHLQNVKVSQSTPN
jgi:hypothetical protein